MDIEKYDALTQYSSLFIIYCSLFIQTRSYMTAAPWPTPTHIVARP